jgi:hypothetical protein
VENIADHWSQKIFYAGKKKTGKEEKWGKEGKKKNRKKERVTAGTDTKCRGCPPNNLRNNFDSGM